MRFVSRIVGRRIHSWLLTARFRIFLHWLTVDVESRTVSHTDPSANLSLKEGAIIDYIKPRLQRYPYWKRGHREILAAYLSVNDIERAYAAVHTFRALCTPKDVWEADFYLSVCFIRARKVAAALPILERLYGQRPKDVAIAEEYAAAHIALGDYDAAVQVLSVIPEKKRTKNVLAALQTCATQRQTTAEAGTS